MAFVQSEDQDNISLTSTFNTTLGSITNSKSPLTSNIHQHCCTRKPNKLERKGKAKIYYCKYCKLGSSTSTTRLQISRTQSIEARSDARERKACTIGSPKYKNLKLREERKGYAASYIYT